MTTYRKIPVEVEALEITDNWFIKDRRNIEIGSKFIINPIERTVKIPTLEGTLTALEGYFIIRGIDGEYYPCKPEIFWKTYEEV